VAQDSTIRNERETHHHKINKENQKQTTNDLKIEVSLKPWFTKRRQDLYAKPEPE
jgi:hypothetical protein